MRSLALVFVSAAAIGGACNGPPAADVPDPGGPPFATLTYVGATGDVTVTAEAVMANGDVLVAGTFHGELDVDPGPGIDVRAGSAATFGSAFVSRLRPDGVARWTRVVGGAGSAMVLGLAADADGAVFAGGTFTGTVDFDPGAGQDLRAATDPFHGFVIKLSPQGDPLWTWALDAPSSAQGVVPLGGQVVVHGDFFGPADFDPGPAADVRVPAETDAFVVVLDRNGRLARPAWTFGGTGSDRVTHVQIGADGAWYVAGIFSDGADLDPGPAELRPTPTGITRTTGGFALALNGDGQLRWAGVYPDAVTITELAVGAQGLFLAGTFIQEADLDPRPGEDRRRPATEIEDTFLSLLDLDGHRRWVRTWGSDHVWDSAGRLILLRDGSPAIAADFVGTLFIDDQMFANTTDDRAVFMAAFDAAGATRWTRWFPNGGAASLAGFAQAPDGTLLVAGWAAGTFAVPASGTVDAPSGRLSGYVARLPVPE